MPTAVQTSWHLPLMLVLTFSTGVIDAVGFLGLDRVFTANMTGNVVILGMGLAGADDLPILGPTLALVGFMLGAALSGRILRRAGAGWSGRTTVILGVVAVVMAGTSAVLFADPTPPEATGYTVTTVLGAAMGMQAAAARVIGVRDVTTVVVTSTIVGLSMESFLGTGKGAQYARRGTAVVLILLGATAGALLLRWEIGAGVALAAVLTAGVAAAGHLDVRRTHAAEAVPA